jgi:putative transposase
MFGVTFLQRARAARIGDIAFSFVYLALRALLGALVRSRRGLQVKDLELLVLRHAIESHRRQVARPRLRPLGQALLAAAAFDLPRPLRDARLVTPRTLFRWHRAFVRLAGLLPPPGRLAINNNNGTLDVDSLRPFSSWDDERGLVRSLPARLGNRRSASRSSFSACGCSRRRSVAHVYLQALERGANGG